jgi:hypothetical protein
MDSGTRFARPDWHPADQFLWFFDKRPMVRMIVR